MSLRIGIFDKGEQKHKRNIDEVKKTSCSPV